jgi:hypothetical protein
LTGTTDRCAVQLAVPAQQRRRGNQKDRPPVAGQQPRQHRQHQPILRRVPRPGHLPAHHHQLAPQHRDLDILGIRPGAQTNQSENPPHDHERQRTSHHDRQPA